MSTPILPFAVWQSGTNQNSIPANDNSLRNQILNGMVIGVEDDAPGGDADGDIYIVGDTPAGAFAAFDEFDMAIYMGGTWYAFAPVAGVVVNVAGALKAWDGADYVDVVGAGAVAAEDVTYNNGASGLSATDVQAAIDELAASASADRSTVSGLATSGSVAIDCALGDYFTLALAGNVSGFTFSNLPPAGHGATLMIRITQDSTPRTVAWPASFKWAGGSAGAVSTGSGAVDVLAMTTFDNGTTWDATLAKAFV